MLKRITHYLTDDPPTRYQHAEFAVPFGQAGIWARFIQRCRDHVHQDLHNNLYGNHPGELDRWADDGGR